jgi:hypothetical protein
VNNVTQNLLLGQCPLTGTTTSSRWENIEAGDIAAPLWRKP